MEQTSGQLNSMLRETYAALDSRGDIVISTKDLASAVFEQIDPTRKAPVLVRIAAIFHLRALARRICAQHQNDNESSAEQSSLFEFKLQDRYPATRFDDDGNEDCFYVLRAYLTVEERRHNAARLRGEANAKMVHADALDAETDHLVRQLKTTQLEKILE